MVDRSWWKPPLLLDGGMATLLFQKGLEAGKAPETWLFEEPVEVEEAHRLYVEAGSDIIQTNTFGATPAKLAAAGLAGQCAILNSRATKIAQGASIGLPTHAYLALSDSKCVDWQAGAETTAGALFAALGLLDIASGPGMLNFESTQSLEKLVLDNEACGLAKRLIRGIGPGFEGSATDLLSEVVEAGHFLKSRHTRASFRSELSFPGPLISRDGYDSWIDQGAKSAADRARDDVEKIINTGNPTPLPEALLNKLQAILSADAERLGVSVPRI